MRIVSVLAAISFLCVGTVASADFSNDGRTWSASEERFGFQLGVGMYRPDPTDPGFGSTYGGDNGPLVNLELQIFALKIPYVGAFGAAVSGGFARYKGNATAAGGGTTTEGTKLTLFPLAVMGLLRIDGLARHTPIPLVFSGKIGFDSIFFIEKVGSSSKFRGRTHGLRWGAQVALELNFISGPRSNALDDDWGINTSYLFFEIIGSDANSRAPLADKFAWTAGLGLTF